MPEIQLTGLATAFGIGLMIGVERERAHAGSEAPAGVRTFALVAVLGALAAFDESRLVLLTFGAVVATFAALAYYKAGAAAPGLTTEVAIVLTYVLGALAMREAELAAGLAVLVTILLASRSRLHDFVRNRLTEHEVADGLMLAAAALIVLPLLPDRPLDPWGLLNLRLVFALAVLFMAIDAAGYIALRAFGTQSGLPLAGFLGGFVSSTAVHSAMGKRAREAPQTVSAAVAGAALSSIATVLKLAAVLGVASLPLLAALALPLALAGAVAIAYGVTFMWRTQDSEGPLAPGRAFNPAHAFGFALVIAAFIAGSALLVRWLGPRGAIIGAGLAGFANVHAGAVSAGALDRADALDERIACIAVLVAFSTNSFTKAGLAAWSGGARFAWRLLPGLVLMVAAAWAGLLL